MRSIRPTPAPSKKEMWAAGREWSATNSKVASAPHPECSIPNTVSTPSACWCNATTEDATSCESPACPSGAKFRNSGSGKKTWDPIIVVVATDAPLIPTQLKRLAKRVSLGLGRNGSYSGDGSGDIFIAFSTANPGAAASKGLQHLIMLPNDQINPIFLATVQATEEAWKSSQCWCGVGALAREPIYGQKPRLASDSVTAQARCWRAARPPASARFVSSRRP